MKEKSQLPQAEPVVPNTAQTAKLGPADTPPVNTVTSSKPTSTDKATPGFDIWIGMIGIIAIFVLAKRK